ncbi:hypothetical protein N7504_009913 [Penicillium tannophilum]|nr:hypothetical protein N7504_009913 [Penicillium tannophilum]
MSSSVACSMVDVIMGGPEVAHFPVMTTGGPADDSTWLEISDFEYDYVVVRQNIASMNVGGAYEVSLAWSMSTNTSSDVASCILAVSVDSTTILETGASASGVRAVTGSWETATAAYTPTASTGIPFVITVSCSEGQSSDSPIIGLADISMISSSCTTSTSTMASSKPSTATMTGEVSWTTASTTYSAISTTASLSSSSSGIWIVTDDLSTLESGSSPEASTATTTAAISSTSDGANWITTDALSTLDAASTVSASSTSATASSTTSSMVTASTGTTVSDDDGTTTLTASTTDGDSLSASISVDSDDSTSAVSGTVSVTDTTALKRKRAESPSCTLYISQDSEVISTTVVDAGSHAAFAACLAADSLDSVELLAICSGSGATIEVYDLTVGSDSSVAEECAASASAISNSFASTSAASPHRSVSSKSLIFTPVSTRSTRPSRSVFASYSQSPVWTSIGLSTLSSTRTSTNTAFASAVTDCPAREKITHPTYETDAMSTTIYSAAPEATATTTFIPTSVAAGSPYVTTETVLTTRISTIYKCPATVTNCPAGEKTTETTTETLVAGTTVYTVSSGSSSSSPSSSSRSGSENTIKATFPTTDTVSSSTSISTGTVTETVAIDLTSSAGFSTSESTDYISTLRSSTTTANAAGSIDTLVNTSTSSPNSAITESEDFGSTLLSTVEYPTTGAVGAGSALSATAGATDAAGAAGTTSETSSLRATRPSGMRVSSSSLPSSFTMVASGVGGVHASSLSTSSSLTTTAGTTATTAPVLNGALSTFSPSLTGVIGLVIAFFM